MKSLPFSVPFCWPLVVRALKKQTIRLLFIPSYAPDEQIRLIARDSSNKEEKVEVECFIGQVTEVFPIQLKTITLEIAKLDGFQTVPECQAKLAELNGLKKHQERAMGHWGFVIRWEPVTTPSEETIAKIDAMYNEWLCNRCRGCTHYHVGFDEKIGEGDIWCDAKMDRKAYECSKFDARDKPKVKKKINNRSGAPSISLDKFLSR